MGIFDKIARICWAVNAESHSKTSKLLYCLLFRVFVVIDRGIGGAWPLFRSFIQLRKQSNSEDRVSDVRV